MGSCLRPGQPTSPREWRGFLFFFCVNFMRFLPRGRMLPCASWRAFSTKGLRTNYLAIGHYTAYYVPWAVIYVTICSLTENISANSVNLCTALKCIASSRNSCATLHPGELKHSIEQRSATPAYLSLYYTYGMLRSTHALDLALDLACPGPCPPSCLAVRLQILQRSTQCFIMSRHF